MNLVDNVSRVGDCNLSSTIVITNSSRDRMIDARTTKVLGALLVAMTIGALLLMAMESEPPRPSSDALASIQSSAVVGLGDVSNDWRRIVLHSSLGGSDTLPDRCHFEIFAQPDSAGRWVRPTARWEHQAPGHHVYVEGNDFNADSIGICLIGDFSKQGPTAEQFEALLALVRSLQTKCNIKSENVYLSSELQPGTRPGLAFPVGEFKSRLGN